MGSNYIRNKGISNTEISFRQALDDLQCLSLNGSGRKRMRLLTIIAFTFMVAALLKSHTYVLTMEISFFLG